MFLLLSRRFDRLARRKTISARDIVDVIAYRRCGPWDEFVVPGNGPGEDSNGARIDKNILTTFQSYDGFVS